MVRSCVLLMPGAPKAPGMVASGESHGGLAARSRQPPPSEFHSSQRDAEDRYLDNL